MWPPLKTNGGFLALGCSVYSIRVYSISLESGSAMSFVWSNAQSRKLSFTTNTLPVDAGLFGSKGDAVLPAK